MKARSVALWTVLGMLVSSAGALAVPISASADGGSTIARDLGNTGDSQHATLARFTSDGTLSVDARLGQAKLPTGSSEDSLLFASVTGGDLDKISA
ncbi:MAG: hypothetical protein ABI461_11630, partial [Polyangiaceae bacterium]